MTITLENICDAPLQDVFDAMLDHLRKQGCRSTRPYKPDSTGPTCLYRNAEGLKCAVGVFITDDQYHSEMEGQSADVVLSQYTGRSVPHVLFKLLWHAQDIHDNYPVESWENMFDALARRMRYDHGVALYYKAPTN